MKVVQQKNRITSLMWLLIAFLATCCSVPALAEFRPTGYGNLPTDGHFPYPPQIQWTGGYFTWPCKSTKALYKNSGKYIPKNVIATRGQIYKDEIFLALPRYKSGVPATLARTSLKPGTCQTTLSPFPCWDLQEEGNCRALQSVVDIVLDANDILWVLDVGVVNTLETPIRHCPPKVVAFSVKTGKVLRTISLEGLAVKNSRLQYLVVDYDTKTGQVYIYVSDAANRAIIVYNVQAGKGRRVILPKAITHGCNSRDVLYIALTHKNCETSSLFFTYLSSRKMFSIRTDFLRTGCAEGRVTDVGTKPKRLVIIGTDNGSAIFFRYEGESEVYRWDSTQCFKEPNFRVLYRCQTCQLATHALADYKRNTMRVLESNFPDYMQNTVGCGAVQQITTMRGCW